MENKMLIDAAHPEETRVVVLRGNRVEEFDYESAVKQQLRGNIYLAKVTRVEPSLQAAFVDYGGNRHGFLAFSEIHPDYYQIPVADRQVLLEEEAEEQSRAEAAAAAEDEVEQETVNEAQSAEDAEEQSETRAAGGDLPNSEPHSEDDEAPGETSGRDEPAVALAASEDVLSEPVPAKIEPDGASEEAPPDSSTDEIFSDAPEAHGLVENLGIEEIQETDDEQRQAGNGRGSIESVGSEDALEELPDRVRRRRRVYNIQEVIKRRQII
ncbi:MAG: hypothetical protein ACR2OX_03165, partial [Methyloligellaceae bacterium]